MSIVSAFKDAAWLTGERVRRIGIVLAIVAFAGLAWNTWSHTRHGLTDVDGEQLGVDFINYWSGAHLAVEGRASMAYDIKAFLAYERSFISPDAAFRWYSYPPITMLITSPLALLSFIPGLICWMLLGGLLWAAVLSRIMDWRMALIAAFAAPASFMNFFTGQNGNLTAVLLAGGLLALRKRQFLAGIFFGLLCYKPHLGVLLPFALAAAGYWRAFVSAALTVTAMIGLSILLLGTETWVAFFHTAHFNPQLMQEGFGFWRRMPTLFAATRLLDGSVSFAYGVQFVSAALALVATVFVWRSDASLEVKSGAFLLGTFLVTPYAWDYDLVVLTFAITLLILEGIKTGFQPWEKITLAAVVAMPLVMVSLAKFTLVQIGPFVLWAAFFFTVRRALAPQRLSTAVETASHPDPNCVSLGA